MREHKTTITSNSVKQSGLTTDYGKAIAEYIWNGFDANANLIEIKYKANELGLIEHLSITDNGTGISIETIDSTFGHFLDSQKSQSFSSSGFIKGKKGKGRYSFGLFCNSANWETTFEDKDGNFLSYNITILRNSLQKFKTSDKKASSNKKTGTKVEFIDIFDLFSQHLEELNFLEFLSSEFGWFLHLNEGFHAIQINGKPLVYESIIEDTEKKNIEIGKYNFNCSYIRWNRKIGDRYFYYFLNDKRKEVDRKHTSFNNKAIDFHHSVYIQSEYFNEFEKIQTESAELGFKRKNQSDQTFKAVIKQLNKFLIQKEKEFIRESKAQDLIAEYHSNNIFPKFKSHQYDKIRLKDLENVIKEIYCIQPRIFQGLKTDSSKTLVGFLNLLLDSEEREKVLEIISDIVTMSDEERTELAKVLRKTKFSKIIDISNLLIRRIDTVQVLKHLVFDLEKFTNERDHIQKVIENNYWLFGEQYHLVSADKNFEVLLNNYLQMIENNKKVKNVIVDKKKKLKRPDIFICQQLSNSNLADENIEENIIVELKRPSVTIGKYQFSQIEDYLRIIIEEPRFNSQLRFWKFYLVGKDVDEFIKDKYDSQKNKGKIFLVESVRNYEIYALKWDDLFQIFNNKHKHLISKLEYRSELLDILKEKGIEMNKLMSNELTKQAIKE